MGIDIPVANPIGIGESIVLGQPENGFLFHLAEHFLLQLGRHGQIFT